MPGLDDMDYKAILAMLEDLRASNARMERAIMGDPTVGHRGLVNRVEALEQKDIEAAAEHRALDDRREKADRRLHERLDEITGEFSRAKATIYGLAVGVGVTSGFGGTWLFNLWVGG